MQTVGFDPNQLSFDDGIRRINQAVKELGFPRNEIVTSRDPSRNALAKCWRSQTFPAVS